MLASVARARATIYLEGMKLPQLHLRDLLWLVLVVAVCCAWWHNQHTFEELERLRIEARVAEQNAALQARESAVNAWAEERKVQRMSWKISERERAVKAQEDDYEMYRRAYFYYRERLPPPKDDDEI